METTSKETIKFVPIQSDEDFKGAISPEGEYGYVESHYSGALNEFYFGIGFREECLEKERYWIERATEIGYKKFSVGSDDLWTFLIRLGWIKIQGHILPGKFFYSDINKRQFKCIQDLEKRFGFIFDESKAVELF